MALVDVPGYDVTGGDVPSDVMGGDGKCYNDMQGDVPGTC